MTSRRSFIYVVRKLRLICSKMILLLFNVSELVRVDPIEAQS